MRSPAAAIAVGRGLAKRPADHDNIGMCLRETRELYDVARRYDSAAQAFDAARQHGRGPAPAGAIHWWLGGSRKLGHVALGVTPGRVLSIDNKRLGGLDVVSLERIRRTWPGLHYVGWTRDLNGVTVLPGVSLKALRAGQHSAVDLVTGALVAEHLLPPAHAGGPWTGAERDAYARWQERAGFGPATPGRKGPSDGDPGAKSLALLGIRRGFVVTA